MGTYWVWAGIAAKEAGGDAGALTSSGRRDPDENQVAVFISLSTNR
jgi:hypothetical protein